MVLWICSLVANVVSCSMGLIKLLQTVTDREFWHMVALKSGERESLAMACWVQSCAQQLPLSHEEVLQQNGVCWSSWDSLECLVNISCEHSRMTPTGSTKSYVVIELPCGWDQPWSIEALIKASDVKKSTVQCYKEKLHAGDLSVLQHVLFMFTSHYIHYIGV